MAEQPGQEKTEQPTQKKLDDARDKGQVAKSMEISSFTVFGTGLLILFLFQGFIGQRLSQISTSVFSSLSTLELSYNLVQMYALKGAGFFFISLSPFFIGILVLALAVNLAQVGIKLSPKALQPKFEKLDPIKGLKNKIFSSRALVEALKSILKLVMIGLFTYISLSTLIIQSTNLLDQSIEEIVDFMADAALSFLWKILIVYAVLSIADFLFQKYKFKKDMMMTKQEIKDEHKQTEGDPFIKGKIKTKQFQMSRNRMIMEVPKADVVITNPTHFAIALKYDSAKNSAPIVLAKGMDEVALKIKEIARKNNIPLYEDKPLAQALYKACNIGDEIPEKLFEAVAKILAFVFKAKHSKRKSIV
ncbi:MAG: flagellar biosynthesis protein FlhB [Ignavibacteriales bacterium]|jgi:flagellar biosynthetic protein FlhB|nr:MAG: flagellar biosynthesis protein FlhB [Ignavibacteriales bacterium]